MGSLNNALDAFLAKTSDRFFVADLDGKLLRWSEALARALPPSLRDGERLLDAAHPDDHASLAAAWSKLREGGEPVTLNCRLRAGEDTYEAYGIEAWRLEGDQIGGELRPRSRNAFLKANADTILRTIADHLPVVVWALDKEGTFMLHEGKALEDAGLKPGQFVGFSVFDLYKDKPGVMDEVRRAIDGEWSRVSNEADGLSWEHWILPLLDERGEQQGVTGASLDVSATRKVERELEAKLQAIESQKQIIRSLATPIIQVWDGVLTMPLVGVVDSVRAAEVMDGLLNEVVRTRARFAVLDVTGVDVMDTATAGHLLRLIRSLRLLGAEGVISGIRPSIAHTMVGIGIEMANICTLRSLREALQHCIRQMAEEDAAASDVSYGRPE